jgi:hypothetical protein
MLKNKRIPLLAKAFAGHNPESFQAYIKSLAAVRATASKEVNAVGIVFKGDKVTVRVKRDPKLVTRDEVATLALEYKKPETLILELFKKRKVDIAYEDNDARRETDEQHFRSKKDAKPKRPSRRKKASSDQLQFFVDHSRLPEEGAV